MCIVSLTVVNGGCLATSSTPSIEYENRGGVGIWRVDDLAGTLESGELDDAEAQFGDHAGDEAMTGCVVGRDGTESVGSDALEHVDEQWTALGRPRSAERRTWHPASQGLPSRSETRPN